MFWELVNAVKPNRGSQQESYRHASPTTVSRTVLKPKQQQQQQQQHQQ